MTGGRDGGEHREQQGHQEQWTAPEREAGYWESVLQAVRDVLKEQTERAARAVDRLGVRSPLADWRRLVRWRYLVPAGLIIFWAGVGVRYWWVGYTGNTPPPPPLIGLWRTTSPAYQDRGFQIDQETIRFYTGEPYPQPYRIRRVRSERRSNGTIHTIEYEQDGAVVSMAVFIGVSGGARLPSLDHILWFKTSRAP